MADKLKTKYHVLADEMNRLDQSSFFSTKMYDIAIRLLSSKITLTLRFPSYAYLRAEVLCEDISYMEGKRFSVADLLMLIYEYFLNRLRSAHNHQDLYIIYRSLSTNDHEDVPIESYRFFQKDDHEEKQMTMFQVTLPRKKVLRCEVFLHDLSKYVPDHSFSIERVLEILFTDFMTQYCAGSNPELIDDLLKNLEE